jgi:hypothetical protein
MKMMNRASTLRPRRLIAISVCAGLVLAACGDDDDDGAAAAAACDPYVAITNSFNGEPDPATLTPLLDELDANAPEEIAGSVAVMTGAARTALETGDFASFETAEFGDAQSEVDPWMFENCDFDQTAEVTASEYEFEGVPEELEVGSAAFLLTNEGEEAHELAIMRKADGVTQSWDEILALPQEEGEALVVQVGGAFAPGEGTQGVAFVDLVPGDYVVTCFVPTGTSMTADGEVTEGTGVPHFMGGMIDEFTVSA